jgi:hypothetical protein
MWLSQCVMDHINKYYQDGTLPPEDTKCRVDVPIDWSSPV